MRLQRRYKKIQRLLKVAQEEEQQKGTQLRRLNEELQIRARQISTLTGYRGQYASALTNDTISVSRLQRVSRFMTSLNDAVVETQNALDESRRGVTLAQEEWLASYRRLDSLQRLSLEVKRNLDRLDAALIEKREEDLINSHRIH